MDVFSIWGLIEIYWATGLKTNSMSILTLIAILVSFQLLIEATKKFQLVRHMQYLLELVQLERYW